MTICPHCKSYNNNFYYCKGCGRKITSTSKPITAKKTSSPKFIEEAIDIIEKNFVSSDSTIKPGPGTNKISLGEISKEEGIILTKEEQSVEQWVEISTQQQCSCFFGELFCLYIVTAIITMAGFIAGADEIEMMLKLYASVFLSLSFISWFIAPYFSGFSPISSVLYNCSLFTSDNQSVKNKGKELIIVFFASSLLYMLIFPIFISMLRTKFSKNYVPGPFLLSETKYLKKIKG